MASLGLSSKFTICNVCNENFSISDPGLRPRILTTCGHSNCTYCCEQLIKNGSITCPACYAVTLCENINSLPQNWLAIQVLDSASEINKKKNPSCSNPEGCSNDAVVFCRNCNMDFCDKCAVFMHEQSILLKNHQIGPLSTRKPMCIVHDDCVADMYCETDKQLVCIKCVAVGKHKHHDVLDVKELAGDVRNELNLESQKAHRLLSSIEKREEELESDEKEVESILTKCLQEASDECEELIKHVTNRKRKIEQEVLKVKKTKLSRCEVIKQLLTNSKLLLTKVKTDCEANMNDFEVLACHVGVKERSMEAENITKQALLEERITTHSQYDKSKSQKIMKLVDIFGNVDVPAGPSDFKVNYCNGNVLIEWNAVKFDREISAYQVQTKRRFLPTLSHKQIDTPPAAAAEEEEEDPDEEEEEEEDSDSDEEEEDSDEEEEEEDSDEEQCFACSVSSLTSQHFFGGEEGVYEEVYNGPDKTVTLQSSNFKLDTFYVFRVRAVSGGDRGYVFGEWSKEATIKTLHPFFDDSVILAPEASKYETELLKMFEQPKKVLKLKLLYRGSRDGFNAASFHAKCDEATRTLTVVRSTTGFISGGFAGESWKGSGSQYTQSENNWLFSLHPRPLKLVCSNPQRAQLCRPTYGPTFGCGHDLHISGSMNRTSSKNCSSPKSYVVDESQYPNRKFTNSTLFGSSNFKVTEIEVFQVFP